MIDWLFRVLCCAIFQPYNCRNVKLSLMWGKERGHFKCQKIKLDYHIQIQCVYNCLTINLVQKFSMHIPYNFNVSRQPLINWLNDFRLLDPGYSIFCFIPSTQGQLLPGEPQLCQFSPCWFTYWIQETIEVRDQSPVWYLIYGHCCLFLV